MFENKKIFILGMARSGYSAAKLLSNYNNEILVTDMNKQDEKQVKELEEKDHLRNWQPPVNGEIIMTTFGIKEGRNVGIIKTAIREAVLDGIIGNNFKEAYEFMKAEGLKLGLTVVHEVTEPIEVKHNGPVPNKIEK